MGGHLDDIVALHETLSELRRLEAQLAGIPDWMQELHEEHSERLGEIQALDEQIEEARRERRASEAAIEDAQQRLKRYQGQINQVSNQREYGALLAEIDAAKAEIAGAEEQALAAMEQREAAESEIATLREAFSDLDTRYKQELQKWEAEKPAIGERIEGLAGAAEVLRERLPRGLLAQFERINERHGGEGLAPVREVDRGGRGPRIFHCGACNYRVRPQVVVEIRGGGTNLVLCDACKRILYLPAEEEA